MTKLLTLCLVSTDTHILLGMKKRGFGAGRWNGFGGKVAPGETIEEAARRELVEECGLQAEALERFGTLHFEFADNPEILEVHVFGVRRYCGQVTESDEMRPRWFAHSAIPYDEMWPDDRHWLPIFLEGRRFEGRFSFADNDTLLDFMMYEPVPAL